MRHASLDTSDRLQRALKVLQEAQGRVSTRSLMRKANICAVNSVVAELRENGAVILCEQEVKNGERRFYYTLLKSPETS